MYTNLEGGARGEREEGRKKSYSKEEVKKEKESAWPSVQKSSTRWHLLGFHVLALRS